MKNSKHRLRADRRAYREGQCADVNAENPYRDTPLQAAWSRGHRDRWVYDIMPVTIAPKLLLAKLILAGGIASIVYSFINFFN